LAKSIEPLKIDGILNSYETIVDDEFIYIVKPYCNKGNLIDALNNYRTRLLTERELRGPAKRISQALKIIHETSYLHGDVRPQSILLHSGGSNP